MRIVIVKQGTKYDSLDVNSIYNQLKAVGHTSIVCLSDTDKHDPETIFLRYGYQGWWSKLELFSPELEHLRPFLFLDLDTIVTANLDEFQECGNEFYMLRDFYRPNGGQSAMMWIPQDTSEIWNAWMEQPEWHMSKHRGDQDFLELFDFEIIQDKFDGHVSYKADNLEAGCPANSKTIHFHGKPKPRDTTGWAYDHWKRYTE